MHVGYSRSPCQPRVRECITVTQFLDTVGPKVETTPAAVVWRRHRLGPGRQRQAPILIGGRGRSRQSTIRGNFAKAETILRCGRVCVSAVVQMRVVSTDAADVAIATDEFREGQYCVATVRAACSIATEA